VLVTKKATKAWKRLGVVCVNGCPFKLYASWDKGLAAYIVKSVTPQHTCQRNMDGNRQLKSSWVAEQMLDVFKSRPHVPSSEIIDLVKQNYKVIINKDFAYKIKYCAHRRLHGSMKQHYNKVMSYLQALREASPESYFSVVTVPESSTAVFQRFFVLFEGVKDGWLKGCRKVLGIDGCFIKTFLGGMLLSAIGRDANEQMFPLAWAIVEGENNESWQWFIAELKKGLYATDATNGAGWTIISDEH
jgi:MULE transposase-like protein